MKVISFNKKNILIILVVVLAVILGGFFTIKDYSERYKVEYNISVVDFENNKVRVDMKILPDNMLSKMKEFLIIKGAIKTESEICINDNGDNLFTESNSGLMYIDAGVNSKEVNYSYEVELGTLGKHGKKGIVDEEMVIFEGESILTLPYDSIDMKDKDTKKITEIVVKCENTNNLETVIVPYADGENSNISKVKSPKWYDFYEIRKSSYVLGKMEKHEIKEGLSSFDIYVDPVATEQGLYNKEIEDGIRSLVAYYESKFGMGLKDYPIVLLRKEFVDEKDTGYVIAGVSSQNSGSTFDSNNLRDWQLMSHRLFHTFFDLAKPNNEFHEEPLLALMEGLSTYYENQSLSSLPEKIKSNLNIDSEKEFIKLFERYTYLRLKDAADLSLGLGETEKYSSSPAKTEFLHYNQSPVLVKFIEDKLCEETKTEDNILKYILSYNENTTITVDKILGDLLKDDYEEIKNNYIYGSEIIPLWYLKSNNSDNLETLNNLNNFEVDMYSWFRSENMLYVFNRISEENLEKISEEAVKENVQFATPEIEENIKNFSPTEYKMLKQYALRAKICEVDFNDTLLRQKLLVDQSKIQKWDDYKKSLTD